MTARKDYAAGVVRRVHFLLNNQGIRPAKLDDIRVNNRGGPESASRDNSLIRACLHPRAGQLFKNRAFVNAGQFFQKAHPRARPHRKSDSFIARRDHAARRSQQQQGPRPAACRLEQT